MTASRVTTVAALAAAICTLAGCSPKPDTTISSIQEPPAAAEKCPPSAEASGPDAKSLSAEFAKLQLPSGTCYFNVYASPSSRHSGKLWVTVAFRMPAPTLPDHLRPIATDVAHLLKKTEIGQRTAVLDVNNMGGLVAAKERVLITDENFEAHPWDGTPSREAEFAIWTPKPPD